MPGRAGVIVNLVQFPPYWNCVGSRARAMVRDLQRRGCRAPDVPRASRQRIEQGFQILNAVEHVVGELGQAGAVAGAGQHADHQPGPSPLAHL